MKVYSIIDLDNDYTYCIVEDKEVAKEIVRRFGKNYYYKEFDTKAVSLDTEYWFYIYINNEGNVGFVEIENESESCCDINKRLKYYKKINDKCYIENDHYFTDTLSVYVRTKDINDAKKIARNLYIKYQKEEGWLWW